MSDELRQAFREYAQMCAALRRFAEDFYYRTNGDYTLIETATEVSRLGQRLERLALRAPAARGEGEGQRPPLPPDLVGVTPCRG